MSEIEKVREDMQPYITSNKMLDAILPWKPLDSSPNFPMYFDPAFLDGTAENPVSKNYFRYSGILYSLGNHDESTTHILTRDEFTVGHQRLSKLLGEQALIPAIDTKILENAPAQKWLSKISRDGVWPITNDESGKLSVHDILPGAKHFPHLIFLPTEQTGLIRSGAGSVLKIYKKGNPSLKHTFTSEYINNTPSIRSEYHLNIPTKFLCEALEQILSNKNSFNLSLYPAYMAHRDPQRPHIEVVEEFMAALDEFLPDHNFKNNSFIDEIRVMRDVTKFSNPNDAIPDLEDIVVAIRAGWLRLVTHARHAAGGENATRVNEYQKNLRRRRFWFREN